MGYAYSSPLESIGRLLNLNASELDTLLKGSNKLGFLVHKKFIVYEKNLKSLADATISSIHHNRELAQPIINLIHFAARFDSNNSPRNNINGFLPTDAISKDFEIIPPSQVAKNETTPERFILCKIIDKEHMVVVDHGDFPYMYKKEQLLRLYTVNPEKLTIWISLFQEFINTVNHWLDLTNGEFILDTFHQFEFKEDKHRVTLQR